MSIYFSLLTKTANRAGSGLSRRGSERTSTSAHRHSAPLHTFVGLVARTFAAIGRLAGVLLSDFVLIFALISVCVGMNDGLGAEQCLLV